MENGGVFNCMFPAGAAADGTPDGTPPVLRVKWSPNCSIPYHYHPTGAMYFIQCESRSSEQPAARAALRIQLDPCACCVVRWSHVVQG